MACSDLQHNLSFKLSLRSAALMRTGYDVVFTVGKIIHAGFYLLGPNLKRRDYALGVTLYSLFLLVTASVTCIAIVRRNSKWLYRVLPILVLTELLFIGNCFTHDFVACTRSDYSIVPPCAFSLMASLIHAGLGFFGLWIIWSYADQLEQKTKCPAKQRPIVFPSEY